jgi:hypothetical protein
MKSPTRRCSFAVEVAMDAKTRPWLNGVGLDEPTIQERIVVIVRLVTQLEETARDPAVQNEVAGLSLEVDPVEPILQPLHDLSEVDRDFASTGLRALIARVRLQNALENPHSSEQHLADLRRVANASSDSFAFAVFRAGVRNAHPVQTAIVHAIGGALAPHVLIGFALLRGLMSLCRAVTEPVTVTIPEDHTRIRTLASQPRPESRTIPVPQTAPVPQAQPLPSQIVTTRIQGSPGVS